MNRSGFNGASFKNIMDNEQLNNGNIIENSE